MKKAPAGAFFMGSDQAAEAVDQAPSFWRKLVAYAPSFSLMRADLPLRSRR